MSIGQQPKILGIVPSYLTMMVNGTRPWKPEIKNRYDQLVNTQEFSTQALAAAEAILGMNNSVVELRRLLGC